MITVIATDLVTRILTGDLPTVLSAAAILTWPVSWALLILYRRAMRRSMMRPSGNHPPVPSPSPSVTAVRSVNLIETTTVAPASQVDDVLLRDLRARTRRTSVVYALGGLAYASTISLVSAWIAEPTVPFRLIRFLLLTTAYAWPLVLTLAIVAGAVRRQKIVFGVVYAAIYTVLAIASDILSPNLTLSQYFLLWGISNLPATVLVALCLNRRIRAVGPLVLVFLILGLLGSDALVVPLLEGELRVAFTAGDWLGLGGPGIFVGTMACGFVFAAVIGAIVLAWLRRRYEAKRFSDESLTIQTVWWIFVFGYAVGFAFKHPLAPLAGVAAMIAFTLVTRVAMALLLPPVAEGRRLLLLRSFSIGQRGERLFDALEKHWRRVGSIQMIAGSDLADRTVEPHEFLDFISGKLSRRFIDCQDTLQRRLKEMDLQPDRDGRFRVNDFFCYDDTWRDVLLALVHQADGVLMDLRGFSRRNAGCVHEIGELFRYVPLERVLFLVDGGTDRAFLSETFTQAAMLTGAAGPMLEPRLLTCGSLDKRTLHNLLHALAATMTPSTARGNPKQSATPVPVPARTPVRIRPVPLLGIVGLTLGVSVLLIMLRYLGVFPSASPTEDESAPPSTQSPTTSASHAELANLLDIKVDARLIYANKGIFGQNWEGLFDGSAMNAADGPHSTIVSSDGFAVLKVAGNKPARFDTLAVFVNTTSKFNVKELAILISSTSPDGPFVKVAQVTVPNYRNMPNPLHELRFTQVEARFVKLKVVSLQNYHGPTGLLGTIHLYSSSK